MNKVKLYYFVNFCIISQISRLLDQELIQSSMHLFCKNLLKHYFLCLIFVLEQFDNYKMILIHTFLWCLFSIICLLFVCYI